jgi:hypothetical protein
MDVWFTPSAVWEVKGADFQVIVHLCSFLPSIHVESERWMRTEGSG